MKHSKLTVPPKANRNCNGGYKQKKPVQDQKMVKRTYNLRDYHGNLKQR